MHGPREVLNELKWRDDAPALRDVTVWYVHRGAPGDARVVPGDRITELGRSFFTLRDPRGPSASIPYHRVFRIARGDEVLWERRVTADAG